MIEPAVTSDFEHDLRRHAPATGVRAVRLSLGTPALVVTGCVLAAAGMAAYYSVRATAWAVMTDELQVALLATSIADRLSLVPTIHGAYYGAHSQLYPLLVAPFYGTLSAPDAATAAHALNALLLAGAAWPAYLLARSVAASRSAGYVAAALTAFTPWLVLASTLLTENAAYPAFVWAVLLCQRTLAAPSTQRDVMALVGLAVAFFARTQLLALAVALPVALVLHEIGIAVAQGTPLRGAARVGVSRAVTRHPVLAGAYVTGAVAAGALVLGDRLGGVVGNYSTPFAGDLMPQGFWSSAAAHFDQIAVGAGILPAVLAASWAVTTILRPERKEAHAFAALLVVLVPLLTFEVTSFDLRFTPEQFTQDRYLFYLVPLFAIGSAAWLVQRTQRTLRLITLVGATGVLAGLLGLASYDDDTIIFWASPAAAFHPAVATASGSVGLSADTFLQIVTVALGLVLAALTWRDPRVALVGTTIVVAGFGVVQAGYVFDRHVEPAMTRAQTAAVRDWIDRAVPPGRSVALVPGGHDGPTAWWEAEHWNKTVDHVLRVDSGPTHTPFPAAAVSVDYETGALSGPHPSDYLVVSPDETRFHVLASERVAETHRLRLVRARVPYLVDWATRGLTADGWTRPRRPAALRLYAHGRPGSRNVVLVLAASRLPSRPVDFVLRTGSSVVEGSVDPGGARPPVEILACVPAAGFAEVSLTSNGRARTSDGRLVSLHVERLEVRDAGTAGCRGAS